MIPRDPQSGAARAEVGRPGGRQPTAAAGGPAPAPAVDGPFARLQRLHGRGAPVPR